MAPVDIFDPADLTAADLEPAPIKVALADTPPPGPWKQTGLCYTTSVPARWFFPRRGDDNTAAKAVCAACPSRLACLAWALCAGPDLVGVFGATSQDERLKIRGQAAQTGGVLFPLASGKIAADEAGRSVPLDEPFGGWEFDLRPAGGGVVLFGRLDEDTMADRRAV